MLDGVNDPARLEVAGDDDGGMGRRAFLALGVGLAGACYAGAIGYPIYRYLAAPVAKAAKEGQVSEVALPGAEKLESGAALMFKFGSRPAMLIHHKDGAWTALEAVCTHLACTVQYEPQNDRIYCACHGGVYDPRTGANVAGPPPRPLKQFKVEVADGQVVVSRG